MPKENCMTDINQTIIEIVAEQAVLEPSDISLATKLEDLGLDSLALVEAVFTIEETFKISVPFNANEPSESDFDFTSPQTIAIAVQKLIKEQHA